MLGRYRIWMFKTYIFRIPTGCRFGSSLWSRDGIWECQRLPPAGRNLTEYPGQPLETGHFLASTSRKQRVCHSRLFQTGLLWCGRNSVKAIFKPTGPVFALRMAHDQTLPQPPLSFLSFSQIRHLPQAFRWKACAKMDVQEKTAWSSTWPFTWISTIGFFSQGEAFQIELESKKAGKPLDLRHQHQSRPV
jgi:hypothetical protein